MLRTSNSSAAQRGLAVVELVFGFVILSILAAVVVPQLRDSRGNPRHAQAVQRLATLRRAIDLYRLQHGTLPDAAFESQLTQRETTEHGSRGPYLRDGMPQNPVTGHDAVRVVVLMPDGPVGSEGWLYDATTGEIRLNASGGPSAGTRWFDF